MPTILFCGDPHSKFDQVIGAVDEHQPEAVILLGDMTLERPLHVELSAILDKTQVWWIPGNHDTDNDRHYDHLYKSELADRNLHGRVMTIAG